MSNRSLLVSGASGHLGRAAIDYLLANAPDDRIVAGTRFPANLKELADRGVEVRELDFDRPETMSSALRGIDRFLIISTDTADKPGSRAEQHGRAVAEAARAGVKHLVYTSMPNPSHANPMGLALDHRSTEEAIAASGIPYTIVRNNWYFENMSGSLPQVIESGVISNSSGHGRAGWISRRDCARAAASALASHEKRSSVRNATGPELLGLVEMAERLSNFAGKRIEAKPVDTESRRKSLEAADLPSGVIDFLINTETGISEGWLAIVSDDVEGLTGTTPQSFAEFLEEHRSELLGETA